MIRIYDMNNYYRLMLENKADAARSMFTELCFCTEPVIVVWDGPGGNTLRRNLYPAYKTNRKPLSPSIFEGFKFLRELLNHAPVAQIMVPKYEGDDVVATLAKRYAGQGVCVGIYSNDFDFSQLRSERIFVGARENPHVEPRFVRLYKATVGDPADCISGIRGFGKVGWERADKRALYEMVRDIGPIPECLSESSRNWCEANQPTLRIMWDIVGFYDVPIELINEHTTKGVQDYATGNQLLERYFL